MSSTRTFLSCANLFGPEGVALFFLLFLLTQLPEGNIYWATTNNCVVLSYRLAELLAHGPHFSITSTGLATALIALSPANLPSFIEENHRSMIATFFCASTLSYIFPTNVICSYPIYQG
jgi:hypothetical protein